MKAKATRVNKSGATQCSVQGRRIFFLDIENYAGKAVLDRASVEGVRGSIERQFAPGKRDLVVVATSHTSNCVAAGLAWRGTRLVMERGKDGADRALLKAIGQYRLGDFSEVFVMSGDGIFLEAVERLASEGVAVRVVSRGDSLNRKLIAAAPCLLAA